MSELQTSLRRNDDQAFLALREDIRDMAEDVNGYESEENQRTAFRALLDMRLKMLETAGRPTVQGPAAPHTNAPASHDWSDEAQVVDLSSHDDSETDGSEESRETEDLPDGGPSRPRRTRRGRRRTSRRSEPIRNLDFRPSGKVSFKDFVSEKKPTSLYQKNVLAVWYLEQVLEVTEIGVGHVLAAYKECSWREPSSPDNSLQVTASKHHWIDTSNMTQIRTTPSGRNLVQYDMPITKKSI